MNRFDQILRRLGWTANTGKIGERLAARHLRRDGYRILARNLRYRLGEIDILAEAPDRHTIVVVEVKTSASQSNHNGSLRPEVHVDQHKQSKLTALACQVARSRRLTDRPIRFDVIGVDLLSRRTRSGPRDEHLWLRLPIRRRRPRIRHHLGAFEATL